MKKKLLKIFIVAFCLAGLCSVFSACNFAGGGGAATTVDGVTVSYAVNGKYTELHWQKVAGVTVSVYRADSRYGEYRLVEKDLKTDHYTDEYRGGYYKLVAKDEKGKTLRQFDAVGEEIDLFGENVFVFAPGDSATAVNRVLEDLYSKQYASEFSSDRYAVLFKAGEYDKSIVLKQGYYTTLSGVGETPEAVSFATMENYNGANGNALINFWRGVENLTVRGDATWAVSQGAFMRSVKINGNLNLSYAGGYSSGGFLANSQVANAVNSGSQQQWFTRNSQIGRWSGEVWNMCFSGVKNAPQENSYPTHRYTTMAATPVIREKPYLTLSENGYRLAVPAEQTNATGYVWNATDTAYYESEELYFARPERDTAESMTAALAAGKQLVLTPGIYRLEQPIVVERDNAVILGMGLATLQPTGKNATVVVRGKNASVAGILFDAGTQKSDSLLDVGTAENGEVGAGTYLFDCFIRVGGAIDGYTGVDTAVRIYANDVVTDNVWLWRADHGKGVGWEQNDGDTGMRVYGNNVKSYGLFGEHFKKHNVLWEGENGYVFFYQSEIAYDVPSQAAWMDGETKGYASLKVADGVQAFTAQGLGIYSNFHQNGITLERAMQAPAGENISIRHVCAVKLARTDSNMTYVIGNLVGQKLSASAMDCYVDSYPNG